ncbi:MAG: ABC transporter ATP-binding protein [Cellvibrio sp.]|nr:ABC transporter ATP-binding protein [Cellvibrio sp.]
MFHKNQNYNKLISIIAADTPRFIYMVLQPYLLMCSQVFVALIILGGLVILDPQIALGAAFLIGGAYVGTYLLIKKSLSFHGEVVTQRSRDVQAILSESFIGIKDIKLSALESAYTARYKQINKKGLDSGAFIALSGDLPRFAIETISFGAILLFAILLFTHHIGSESLVSILSVYALAGYKLLPTMQQIYKSLAGISANGGVVLELKANLEVPTEVPGSPNVEQMPGLHSIVLRRIEYQYPGSSGLTLDNVSLKFERGLLNTIAGPSGSGKSTLADLILGLLAPSSGEVIANNVLVDESSIASYQRSIGYVPQNIFILDDTVVANVAFGVSRDQVDLDRVIQALIQASAIEFVERLPRGLNSQLGQDGKLLSGGQGGVSGIARALYRRNQVLVLDEPTSALDIASEHDLMSLLNRLKKMS